MSVRCFRPLALLLVLVSLAACGGEGGGDGARPTLSPSLSPSLSPTRLPTASPTAQPPSATRSPARTDETSQPTPEPGSAGSSTPPVTSEAAPAQTASSSESAGSADEPDAEAGTDDEGAGAWIWWLLAVVLVAAVGLPLLLARRRRGAWRRQLSEAEAELAWFARELLPQLRRATSVEQVAGGWAVAASRVTAAEDRLTVLEPNAPDDAARNRTRALRDASRLARDRLTRLTTGGGTGTWALDLDEAMADLDAALRPAPTSRP